MRKQVKLQDAVAERATAAQQRFGGPARGLTNSRFVAPQLPPTAQSGIPGAGPLSRTTRTPLGQIERTTRATDRLTQATKGLLTTYLAFSAVRNVFNNAAEIESQTRSLKVLTGELDTAKNIVRSLQDFGALTPFTSSELIDTARRLAAFGVETNDLIRTTKQLADVAGATGADLGGIATSLRTDPSQRTPAGRRAAATLQERGIGLQEELQKMYGLTGTELA